MDIRFGNLTTQAGQKINFADFDKDGDGKISEQEYKDGLKEFGLDTVELSNIDKNNDKTVSNDEFQLWEQKIKMEEALKPYFTQITTDFTGKNCQYVQEMNEFLRNYLDSFAENYSAEGKELSNLADEFAATLDVTYETKKTDVLNNTPDAIKSRVLDKVLDRLAQSETTIVRKSMFSAAKPNMSEDELKVYTKQLGQALEKAADAFIADYKGDDLEIDLTAHLTEVLTDTDSQKMSDAVENFQTATKDFGNYVDTAELQTLKDETVKLLTEALNNGIAVTLGGYTYPNVNTVKVKINEYTDAEKLQNDVQEFINGLSTETLTSTLRTEAIQTAAAEDAAAFAALAGSECQVDASIIDYSKIDGYYDNESYTVKGKKSQAELKDQLEDKLRETINSTIKSQMRAQIDAMLLEKGISTDKIDEIFENVFNASMNEVFDAEGMISTKNRTLFRRGNASCNIKDVVDTFIQTFNTNITKSIDEINASSTDMDLADIDYTVVGDDYANDEKFGALREENRDAKAEKMIDSLRNQLLAKSRAMCKANGVEFNPTVFSTIFTNSKGNVIGTVVPDGDSSFFSIIKDRTSVTVLLDTFTADFKENYTAWVEKQKDKQ